MDLFRKGIVLIGIILLADINIGMAQQGEITEEQQIDAAVSPAPEEMQDEATVMGYGTDGNLETLREGSNKLICIADDPDQDNFHVACYHEDLEPFMQRGRELKQQGLSTDKVDSIRYKEIEEGKIELPEKPMALYSLTGSENSFDYSTGIVQSANPLYVIYIPNATEESTGLSKKPVSKGAPWIMDPGTPWAHIMVMTGRGVGSDEDIESGPEQ